MKHLKKIIFVLSLTLIFASCKKDEVSDETTIDGLWKLTEMTVNSTTTGSGITMVTIQTLVSSTAVINFDNGSYTSTGEIELNSVTTANGTETSNSNYTSTPFSSGTYTIDGNEITFDQPNSELSTATISEKTDTSMTLKTSQEQTQNGFTTTLESTQVLTKQ